MADQHDETTEARAAPEAGGAGDVRPSVASIPPEPGDGLPPVAALPTGADVAISSHQQVDRSEHAHATPSEAPTDLTPLERRRVIAAFVFSCEHHADQRRQSGEEFIVHPVGVAKICAGMRLDTETLCAALLHDTVEDTTASLDEVRENFGEEIAGLVDGVTKLTGITFSSRDEAQAENYRKMMVAMASDIRVILIKLADRLHNMRTIEALPKQKQIEKAKETLDIHALWKPLPGRFKDFIAMPKFNMYQSLHTTVIGPEGRPLEIQIRTREMHDLAEYGIAAHWMYKETSPRDGAGSA